MDVWFVCMERVYVCLVQIPCILFGLFVVVSIVGVVVVIVFIALVSPFH